MAERRKKQAHDERNEPSTQEKENAILSNTKPISKDARHAKRKRTWDDTQLGSQSSSKRDEHLNATDDDNINCLWTDFRFFHSLL